MKKKRIACVMILAVTLSSLSGCASGETPQSETTGGTGVIQDNQNISELIDMSDRLHFPETDLAVTELGGEGSYIGGLSDHEKKFYLFDAENQNSLTEGMLIRAWTQEEKEKIIKIAMEFEDAFKGYGVEFNDSIDLIKISSASRLPTAFISASAVVLDEDVIGEHKDDLKEVLMQQLFRLYLSQNPKVLEKLAVGIGYEPVEGLLMPQELYDDIVIRAGIARPFIYRDTLKDIEDKTLLYWVPLTVIDGDSGTLTDVMVRAELAENGEAHLLKSSSEKVTGENVLASSGYVARPMTSLENAYVNFGELPEKYSHPEDILALNFMYLVLNRTVTGNGTVEKLRVLLK